MITLEDITGQNNSDPLSDEQVLALTLLVRQYDNYQSNIGNWPDFVGTLDAEKSAKTVKTKALKAVLARLSKLPKIKVESNGTDKSRSFFSTKENWDALAKDVLDILYADVIVLGNQRMICGQHPIRLNTDYTFGNRPFFII